MWARNQLAPTTLGNHDDPQTERDEALAAFGLVLQQDQAARPVPRLRPVYLWPCNVATWLLWLQLQTQWRITADMGGGTIRTGLDYASAIAYLRHVAKVRPKDWVHTWAALRSMEIAAINTWADMRTQREA